MVEEEITVDVCTNNARLLFTPPRCIEWPPIFLTEQKCNSYLAPVWEGNDATPEKPDSNLLKNIYMAHGT